jgi:hypothetical protein
MSLLCLLNFESIVVLFQVVLVEKSLQLNIDVVFHVELVEIFVLLLALFEMVNLFLFLVGHLFEQFQFVLWYTFLFRCIEILVDERLIFLVEDLVDGFHFHCFENSFGSAFQADFGFGNVGFAFQADSGLIDIVLALQAALVEIGLEDVHFSSLMSVLQDIAFESHTHYSRILKTLVTLKAFVEYLNCLLDEYFHID